MLGALRDEARFNRRGDEEAAAPVIKKAHKPGAVEPDAWYDPASVRIGYEISFTRYFYQPQPLRSLAQIRADILAVERETEGLLAEIIGDGEGA